MTLTDELERSHWSRNDRSEILQKVFRKKYFRKACFQKLTIFTIKNGHETLLELSDFSETSSDKLEILDFGGVRTMTGRNNLHLKKIGVSKKVVRPAARGIAPVRFREL